MIPFLSPRSSRMAFVPLTEVKLKTHSSMELPSCAWRHTFRVSSVDAWGTTAGIVKLLLPPRQSRGNSQDIRLSVFEPHTEAIRKGKMVKPTEFGRQRWFRRGQRWRVGSEGRISVLKRRHGLTRCRYRGRHASVGGAWGHCQHLDEYGELPPAA
jgi:hypothetical protein